MLFVTMAITVAALGGTGFVGMMIPMGMAGGGGIAGTTAIGAMDIIGPGTEIMAIAMDTATASPTTRNPY